MATIQVPVSDDKILELLHEKYGLDRGSGRVVDVEVKHVPLTNNTTISHTITVSISFGLELGEIEDLVGY
jgi:hypothetical protein